VLLLSFLFLSDLSVFYFSELTTAAGREIYVDDSFSFYRDSTAEHPYQTISEDIGGILTVKEHLIPIG